MRRPLRAPILGLLTLLAGAGSATAQVTGLTPGDWSRVETGHFLFVYPDELGEWALDMAGRMEAVHAAVAELVGYAPEDRVTVLVDDPGNVSNGSMIPGPLLYVWPTPPSPRSLIGENRGWGEILAVHEFAHAAHLTRPSRNPGRRFLMSLLPLPVTDLMRRTPRWATEGYATYIEGRLTGSGRPHGVWRPAVLRTWALEGRLPSYARVSAGEGFYGGAMAYLVGSAYLEWLVEREGGDPGRLTDVWRRLTARQPRSFGGAFEGVFGAPPDELYGRFVVDVTERALAVRDAVADAGGVVDGHLFQRWSWYTGDPAVSPDGRHVAIRLDSEDGPSRLVVLSTTPDTLTTGARQRYRDVFEEDPEDVEPVRRRPRHQEALATLDPVLGRDYTAPAWMPDGEGILAVRSDLVANGRSRPDLFLWRWRDGAVTRVTRGAAIREAAPAPDGRWAAGIRCLHSLCDIVRIDLDDGAVTPLTDTDPLRPFYHPRVSPDGRTIVASVQTPSGWRLVALDADGGDLRRLGPEDGAARFDAEFLPDGALVVTSTRGGIHDLERLDPATGTVVPLTRVLGAAVAPSVALRAAPDSTPDDAFAPSDFFFLSLHSRGWELRRLPIDAPPATPVVRNDPGRFPAATVPLEPGVELPAVELGAPRPYGLGPRFRTLLPMVHLAEDGLGGGFALGGTDPIGRLSWQIQGLYGTDAAPVGASLRLRYRGLRPGVLVEGFWTRDPFDLPSTPPSLDSHSEAVPDAEAATDMEYTGALAAVELRRIRLGREHGVRAGGSVGRLTGIDRGRVLGFTEYEARLSQGPGHWRAEQAIRLHGAVGRTADLDWTRWRASGSVSLRGRRLGLGLSGSVAGTDAPGRSLEGLAVGGPAVMLHDGAVLSQRIAMPALAAGSLRGDRVATAMAEIYGALPLATFFWIGDAGGDGLGRVRIVGTRLDQETPPVPFVRLPAGRFTLGIARVLDEPAEDEWRAWLTIGFQP